MAPQRGYRDYEERKVKSLSITVGVKLTVEYDDSCPGARDAVIKRFSNELPSKTFGFGSHGMYSSTPDDTYLIAVSDVIPKNATHLPCRTKRKMTKNQ